MWCVVGLGLVLISYRNQSYRNQNAHIFKCSVFHLRCLQEIFCPLARIKRKEHQRGTVFHVAEKNRSLNIFLFCLLKWSLCPCSNYLSNLVGVIFLANVTVNSFLFSVIFQIAAEITSGNVLLLNASLTTPHHSQQ